MKKIIIASCFLVLTASAVQAQSQRRKPLPPAETTTTVNSQDGSSVTVTTPGHANTTDVNVRTTTSTPQYPVQNGGIIIPDHAYEVPGTPAVGFFGNGTGGSTIGSTQQTGGGSGANVPLRSNTTTGTTNTTTNPKR
jgi:hypothetical protein